MFAPLSSRNRRRTARYRRLRRAAFTLIELLVVITVIAILVGLLLPAVSAVRKAAFETTVATDIAQLDASLESFKREYGIYPSDFSEFVDANGDPLAFGDSLPNVAPFYGQTVSNRLLQVLAKISPSHNEMAADPVDPARSRLQVWWETVGVNLAVNAAGPNNKAARLRGPQVAAWFWTTQLFNDAQYPLTGPRLGTTTADSDGNGIPDNEQIIGELNSFHDFPNNQLEVIAEIAYPEPGADLTDPAEAHNIYQIARPIQRGGDAPILYFHHATYVDAFTSVATTIDFGETINLGMACGVPESNPADLLFIENTRFQLITAGYDEKFGDLRTSAIYENRDNLCNFSEGRLDTWVDNYSN